MLNGAKMWITNGPVADTLIVYAKTDPAAGARGISAFLIEKGFKGFRPGTKLDKLGMRGSDTSELVFEDCEVPEENLVGALGTRRQRADERARLRARGARRRAARHHAGGDGHRACPTSTSASSSASRSATFQLIQGKLADMYVAMNASRAYVYAVAKACDRGETTREDAAGAILYSAERATQVALDAIQILGGNGYTNDYPLGRLLRDAKLYEIGAGTSEIRRMLIGRELFAKDA